MNKRYVFGLQATALVLVVCLMVSQILLVRPVLAYIGWAEHIIDDDLNSPVEVHAADLDGDGDMDVIVADGWGREFAWWENDGNGNFTKHVIEVDASYWPRSVHTADVDGDGDIDVLGAECGIGSIMWWENDGNQNFTKHVIDSSLTCAWNIRAVDLDGDGDMDVVAGYDGIAWWENDGNQNFTKHVIANIPNSQGLCVADVDGDGDMDIIASAHYAGYFSWFENDGSPAVGLWEEHLVERDYWAAEAVNAADVDGDGDMDILATGGHDISWWENDGNQNFTKHTLSGNFTVAYDVYAIDIRGDGDGHLDILGCASHAREIAWWENDGNENFTKHVIDADFNYPEDVYPADMDGDGDIDVLGAASGVGANTGGGAIAWWENLGEALLRCAVTATGTGTACLTTSHGFIEDLQAIPPHSLPSVTFPHGMFSFRITGLPTGQTVTLTVELPSPVPVGTVWWKYDNGRWHSLPNLSDDGDNTMVIQLTDGGVGDSDSIPGQITDPGGPGNPMTVGWETLAVDKAAVVVPWIGLLAAIAGASLLLLRRRRSID